MWWRWGRISKKQFRNQELVKSAEETKWQKLMFSVTVVILMRQVRDGLTQIWQMKLQEISVTGFIRQLQWKTLSQITGVWLWFQKWSEEKDYILCTQSGGSCNRLNMSNLSGQIKDFSAHKPFCVSADNVIKVLSNGWLITSFHDFRYCVDTLSASY